MEPESDTVYWIDFRIARQSGQPTIISVSQFSSMVHAGLLGAVLNGEIGDCGAILASP